MIVIGGATGVATSLGMAVAKVVLDKDKDKRQAPCRVCETKRKVACDVCQGERIIKYWPMAELPPVQMHTWSVCAMCEGSGEHSCFNCLGSGMENKL